MNESDTLRAQVLERYASVYAFCRAHPELKRATVYLVLSGRYPGKWSFQAARIRAALTGAGETPKTPSPGATESGPEGRARCAEGSYGHRQQSVTREVLAETLQNIRCAHCRRLDRRECMACRDQTEREGKELFGRLFAAAVATKEATDGDSIAQEK